MNVMAALPATAKNDPSVLDLAELSTVEGFMQRVFRKGPSDEKNPADLPSTSSCLEEFDRTSALIDEASQAIGALSSRCEILELELEQERSACAEQQFNIDMLKSMVLDLKARNAIAEGDVKAMTQRCEAAEARTAELEQYQTMATLRVSKAETMSLRLQKQVEAAFGQGSPIRSVMDSAGLQQAAE